VDRKGRNSLLIIIALVVVTLLGAYLRFYKLDWGNGNFFHPDEYHIAGSADQLHFPDQMHPHFFAYGTFTIYLIYFTKLIISSVVQNINLNTFLIGRFYSALFSTLTIPLIYLIGKRFLKSTNALLAAFFIAITPGLIQQAHFTTPESILTFWLLMALYFGILWLKKEKQYYLLLSAVSAGLAMATKVVALTLLPVIMVLPITKIKKPLLKNKKLFVRIILIASIAVLTFVIVFPYSLLAKDEFVSSMRYETGVGRGDPLVFYIRQFIGTKPFIFQMEKIFPYALGPLLIAAGFIGLVAIFVTSIKEITYKKRDYTKMLVVAVFLSLFLPNIFLFAKWTRFMAPSLPFFALFTAYLIETVNNIKRRFLKNILLITLSLLLVANLTWTMMFFSIYTRDDVRVTATEWINENLPASSFILTEQGNMLEVPLTGDFIKKSFDFYNLDENQQLKSDLPPLLTATDYFIIQSRRIYYNHLKLPARFPTTSNFYYALFSGKLGFEKIAEFDSYPQLNIAGRVLKIPDEDAEETWTVFDHPVLRVYKKVNPLTQEEYGKIIGK
jgi:hypothetical protein